MLKRLFEATGNNKKVLRRLYFHDEYIIIAMIASEIACIACRPFCDGKPSHRSFGNWQLPSHLPLNY